MKKQPYLLPLYWSMNQIMLLSSKLLLRIIKREWEHLIHNIGIKRRDELLRDPNKKPHVQIGKFLPIVLLEQVTQVEA